ncbi:MAG: hypothetical protein E6X86_04675 [Clostridium butyricum]|nr:hypothetical protein [Clostridium butyricum]MDU4750305.1 hypothetical protein [Clostridium butyricum]MDU4853394.1 hypothetical protein [Clostridioides difficile]
MVKVKISYENETEKDNIISAISAKNDIKKISKPCKGDKFNKVYLEIK